MYLRENSGTQTVYLLSNIEKVCFSPSGIIVSKTTGAPETYALSSIRYLNFNDLASGVSLAENPNSAMRLYPNPAIDLLNIQPSILVNQASVIEIISIGGKVVHREKTNALDAVYQIDVSALPKSIYLCRINNGKTIETMKFIKR